MNPSLEWGSKKELYRDVRRCKACRSSASLASLVCIWLARLWRPFVFSYFFGPPLPFNIRPEHLIIRMARIPVPQALWSSHGGEELVIHTTAFYHCGIIVIISHLEFRIQDIPSRCCDLEFNASMTCAGRSQKQKTRRAAWPRKVLVTTSDLQVCAVCAADQLHHDDHGDIVEILLVKSCHNLGGSQLHQVNFKADFIYTCSNFIYSITYRQTTYHSRCSLHRWRLKTSILHDLRGFEAWR